MRISVILPVYNAGAFVETAIASALDQDEVAEVIVVEDGSTDDSLAVCEAYALRDPKIKLLRHPNGENRGVSASRNLGILNATAGYIAFLDADDQYVNNRFHSTAALFARCPDADGVYGHLGVYYYHPEYKQQHLKRIPAEITGMNTYIQPGDLQRAIFLAGHGHISVITLVIRREILRGEFLFDESLRMAEDTDFLRRLSGSYRLYALASKEVVGLRGVHAGNRVFDDKRVKKYRRIALRKCIRNNFYGCTDRKAALSILKRYLGLNSVYKKLSRRMRFGAQLGLMWYIFSHPRVMVQLLRMDGNVPPMQVHDILPDSDSTRHSPVSDG